MNIEARIERIAEELRRRAMEQEAPVDELSKSLYELEQELTGLDDLGKAALLEELNSGGLGLDMADLERMIGEWAQ